MQEIITEFTLTFPTIDEGDMENFQKLMGFIEENNIKINYIEKSVVKLNFIELEGGIENEDE